MGGLLSQPSAGAKTKTPTRSNKIKINCTDRAVLDLKVSRDKLRRYKNKLDTDEGKLLSRARELNRWRIYILSVSSGAHGG